MTSLINFLRKIPSFHDCSSYHPLPKKSDDSGIMRAEAWMKANPIEEGTLKRYGMTSQQVDAHGRKIILGLNVIHVDSSNEELVKNYLIKVCEKNYEIRRFLLDHLTEIRADCSVRIALHGTIALSFPPN
jgi:hypothetical protein